LSHGGIPTGPDPQGGYAADGGDDADTDDEAGSDDSDGNSESAQSEVVRLERPSDLFEDSGSDFEDGEETARHADDAIMGGNALDDQLSSEGYLSSDYEKDLELPQLGETEPDTAKAYTKLAKEVAGLINENPVLRQSRVKEVVRIRNYAKRSVKVLSTLSALRSKHSASTNVSVGKPSSSTTLLP
jgi:hypothetical protein